MNFHLSDGLVAKFTAYGCQMNNNNNNNNNNININEWMNEWSSADIIYLYDDAHRSFAPHAK